MVKQGTEIIQGDEADRLLADEQFHAEWSGLVSQCPWATAFQSPGYAVAWYRTFRQQYSPMLVLRRTSEGRLQGLMALALPIDRNEIVAAGDCQAGYQVWVCPAEAANTFPPDAIHEIHAQYPGRQLELRYLPPGSPLTWLDESEVSRVCLLATHRRPLMRFGDGQEIDETLKKSSNRSRLNRLQKLGPMSFKRITDPAELEARFAEIMTFHDTRHVAVNGHASFHETPRAKTFAMALMRPKGLIHATILTFGDQLASAHLGACSGKEVELGLITHNPWLAKHSPGKFHIYFLARMLRQEGYEQLDLTPGGGAHYYKERFANAWDQVHTLTVFASPLARKAGAVGVAMKGTAQKTLNVLHVTPNQARLYAGQLRHLRPSALPQSLNRVRAWMASGLDTRIYSHATGRASSIPVDGFRRDCLEDLLSYRPGGAQEMSKQEFMAEALERIEDGQHLYSYVQDNQLLYWGWLIERPSEEVGGQELPGVPLASDVALALDFHTDCLARGRGLEMRCLQAMLRDTSGIKGIRQLIAAIPDGCELRGEELEMAGFGSVGTLEERRVLGWRWRRLLLQQPGDSTPTRPPVKLAADSYA